MRPAHGDQVEPLAEHEQQDEPQPERRHRIDEQRGVPEGDIAEAARPRGLVDPQGEPQREVDEQDRKSTRLNSSHLVISYAVFCLKKKKKNKKQMRQLTRTPKI